MGPLIQWSRPLATQLDAIAASAVDDTLTYEGVGLTGRPDLPPSPLGAEGTLAISDSSLANWERARKLLFERCMFARSSLALPSETAVVPRQVFAYGARFGPMWTMHACRVVYIEDGGPDADTAAFAHGTLPTHGVRGEERFEIKRRADSITFRVVQCSWPLHRGLALAHPVLSPFQRRVLRESIASLQTAMSTPPPISLVRSVCENQQPGLWVGDGRIRLSTARCE